MPLTIPPFAQYQAPLIAVPGRWHWKPPEGDHMIPVEIDWLVSTANLQAVELSLTSFSPVQFSQIVALSVDNNRAGCDVDFLFPDTGKQLTVPAGAQGTFGVFTNSMTFYVIANGAVTGDVTVFTVLNSMPPPVAVPLSQEQTSSHTGAVGLSATGQTAVVLPPTSGTLEAVTIQFDVQVTTGPVNAAVALRDGTGVVIWQQGINYANATSTQLVIPLTGLKARFSNGLYVVVLSTTMTTGAVTVNAFYSVP